VQDRVEGLTRIFVTQNSLVRNNQSMKRVKRWIAKIGKTIHRVEKIHDE
jgi:hypothetical protein